MSLDPDQTVSLLLAGTVALPSPFPASGPVEVIVQEVGEEIFLKVTHRVNRRLKVARIVTLNEVRVILAAKGLAPEGDESEVSGPGAVGEWFATPSGPLREYVRDLVRAALDRRRTSQRKDLELPPLAPIPLVDEAILYVPEMAPVLMHVEVSMTAAESANYYPPMAVRGSHGLLCDQSLRCDSLDKRP